jgi:cation diffusion facilitator family transporter
MTRLATLNGRYRDARLATVVGAVVNLALAVVKVIIGIVGQSHALITDGIHSLSDLATDALVLVAARHGSRDADADHPYGHGRIETAFTVALGVFLLLVSLGISIDAGRRLFDPRLLLHPEPLALVVALVSVLSKELLYQYTMRVARRLRSPLLKANAWHHRTDALSSVVVLTGIAGSLIGLEYLDALASVGVALMIARIGWDVAWDAIRELVDTGLEPERVTTIRNSILAVEGVNSVHMLRTRRMGADALVDVHVQVNPRLSVSEGHQIGEYVRTKLVKNIEEVADVTVHVDPEDDDRGLLCAGLPLRPEFIEQLKERWQPILNLALLKAINLHYLSGKIHVDLVLPLDLFEDSRQTMALKRRLLEAAGDLRAFGSLKVYYR